MTPKTKQATGAKPDSSKPKDENKAKAAASANGSAKRKERLRPGELDGLVLRYMEKNPAEPVGPTVVGTALQRSAGAVGNSLARLARAKKVRQVNQRPRRHDPLLTLGTTLDGWARQRTAEEIRSALIREPAGEPTAEHPLLLEELIDLVPEAVGLQLESRRTPIRPLPAAPPRRSASGFGESRSAIESR